MISGSYNLYITVGEYTYLTNSLGMAGWLCDNFRPVGDYTFLGPLYLSVFNPGPDNTQCSIVKKGDWRATWHYYFPGGTGASAALTNEYGNLTIESGDFYIGSGDNCTAQYVSKTGDVTVATGNNSSRYFRVAHKGTATVEKEAGDWTVRREFQICANAGAKGRFYHRGGTLAVKDTNKYILVGNANTADYDAYLEISGGTVSCESAITIAQQGKPGSRAEILVKGSGTLHGDMGLNVGYDAAGTLTIQDGGLVDIPNKSVALSSHSSDAAEKSYINLEGGVLRTRFVDYGSGSAVGTLTFDGGTLKAAAGNTNGYFILDSAKLAVLVGDNGGTIDTSEAAVEIPASIANASGASGGLAVVGGRNAAFTGTLSYAGATTVELGTSVSFATKPAGGIAVSAPAETPSTFAYSRISLTGGETFTQAEVDALDTPSPWSATLSSDAKFILFTCNAAPGGAVWVGGTSGTFSTAANWLSETVPASGAAVTISSSFPATLDCDIADFSPSSITFPAGTAKVTIGGTGNIAGISSVTNLSSANHEFTVPVSGGDVTIYNSSTYCIYTGGLTVDTVAFGATGNTKCSIYGNWHIKGDWHPVSGNALYSGALVTVDGTLLNPNNISINSGCVVTAATMSATGDCQHFAYVNNGRLVVTGLCTVATTVDPYFARVAAKDNATVEFGSFYANTPGKWTYATAKHIVVGAGGMDGATRIHFQNGPTLHSRTEAFSLNSTGGAGYSGDSTGVTIDTTQYGTESSPATVTINAVYTKQSNSNPGAVKVTGCGTVVFNTASTFSNGLTASDTATVAVNAGCKPGAGTVTLNGTSTLKVAQSGAVVLGGALTVAEGAALAFNFTDKRTAPTLSVSSATISGDALNVKVSAADGVRPRGGKHSLTSGGAFTGVSSVSLAAGVPKWVASVAVVDGDVVLTAKPSGTMVIVR